MTQASGVRVCEWCSGFERVILEDFIGIVLNFTQRRKEEQADELHRYITPASISLSMFFSI